MVNIFQNSSKFVPTDAQKDAQIDRFSLDVNQIGGRKSGLPPQHFATGLPVSHVPNNSNTPGER